MEYMEPQDSFPACIPVRFNAVDTASANALRTSLVLSIRVTLSPGYFTSGIFNLYS